MSPVFIPAHVRATRDLTEFYEKSPEEMSRYELAELEKLLKMTDEEREAWEQLEFEQRMQANQFDDDGNQLSVVDQYKHTEDYLSVQK